MMEPYRKGTPFADWVDRLEYFFMANKVDEEMKKAHFITMSGPSVFSELKLLYPNSNISDIPYSDMIKKLKSRLDKKPSGLVQRFKFSQRTQQLEESLEDYVLSIKLQAEFCSFGSFKDQAVRDRIISGIRDTKLQEKLLNEDEELSLDAAEKIITTWEMAQSNAKSLGIVREETDVLAMIKPGSGPVGPAVGRILQMRDYFDTVNKGEHGGPSRASVKSRLGFKPYQREQRPSWNKSCIKPADWRPEQNNKKDFSALVCNFCGVKGHIKKYCFKLKNLKRDAVKFVGTTSSW